MHTNAVDLVFNLSAIICHAQTLKNWLNTSLFFPQACALAMGWRKCVFPARLMSNYWLRLNCYIDLMDFCFGCRSTQNKLMNDCHKWKQLNLIRRELWRLRDKKRTEKAGSESDVQKGVWDTNRREREAPVNACTHHSFWGDRHINLHLLQQSYQVQNKSISGNSFGQSWLLGY